MTYMLRKIILLLLFIGGLSIFSYPIISNWIHSIEHYTVIDNHKKQVKEMSEGEKNEALTKAQKYNEALTEAAIPISDPFLGEIENEQSKGYYDVLNIGETIGHLEVPSINVNLPIYHGISDDVLQRGIGHMSNSSFPVGGKGTHSALTGHRGLPSSKLLRHLDKVKMNDLFYIHMLNEVLAYRVDDIQIVIPSDTNWLSLDDNIDYVTFITCEPYMINTHRLLVRGERVPYEDMEAATETAALIKEEIQKAEQSKNYLYGIGISVIGLIVIMFFVKRRKIKE